MDKNSVKQCYHCKNHKSLSEFHKSKETKDGFKPYCKSCRYKIEYRKLKDKDPELYRVKQNEACAKYREKRKKAGRLKEKLRNYNITEQEYLALKDKQNNSCAICKNPEVAKDGWSENIKNLAIDHGHNTGRVRGLLCQACNKGLGLFRDNSSFLTAAIAYLSQ